MIEAAFAAVGAIPWAVAWWGARKTGDIYRRAWEAEVAETRRLQTLLMARSAPAEYAAYVDPPAEDKTTWLFSDDGLVAVPLDPDDA